MTTGTKSYLIGCHQFLLHPLFVTIAWKKYHKRFPRPWELVCILIHDIGIVGKDYLKPGGKSGHWIKGTRLAGTLFGLKGTLLVKGHTSESRDNVHWERSNMFIPDKTSYLYAPMLWLRWCTWVEGFIKLSGITAYQWHDLVKKNAEAGFPNGAHKVYMDAHITWGDKNGTSDYL